MSRSSAPPPRASYRLQLTPSFGFDRAAALAEPLSRLGVSHLYLSPVAASVPDSQHGYDVVDHRVVRAELGGFDRLWQLLDVAGEHGLGVLIDHVPNHVSVAAAELNPHWWSTLREGPESVAARWFDIEWEAADGRVIVPKLGAPLDELIEAGELTIERSGPEPVVRYGPLRFPMAPGTEELPLADALAAQHYRLQFWRDPPRNVRRFFTIDDLVAVRVEDDDVADAVDTIPRRLRDHPAFDGVRVDHVDGLADPGGYLHRLRSMLGKRRLVVEKILAPGELLPRRWHVDGTTGYEHVTVAEHTLLDPTAEHPLDELWREQTADDADFHTVEERARRSTLDGGLRPDRDRLVRSITSSGSHRADRHSPEELRDAVVELTIGLDRYRTYLPDDDRSDDVLARATAAAAAARPDLAVAIADVANVVGIDAEVQTRWQQLTGPVMAKGAEDRAFYRYLRLASLCEVGGSPGDWTYAVADFHDHQRRIQDGWPRTMLTDTTHDTKRSGAVRARSLALAARAGAWADFVRNWTAAHPEVIAGVSGRDVLLALQTVVTSAPIDAERLGDYLVKAAREAELSTTWTEPGERYEAALHRLATHLADEVADLPVVTSRGDTGGGGSDAPPDGVAGWAAALRRPGAAVGMRLLALQLTAPGVPDLYQGAPAELLSLVDPDNRRPPDWEAWRELLDEAADTDVRSAWAAGAHDVARTALVRRVLDARRRRPRAFGPDARYLPLETGGAHASEVIAFTRTDGDEPLVAVAVARASAQMGALDDTTVDLPAGSWRSLLQDDAPILAGGERTLEPLMDGIGAIILERTDR